MIRALVLDYGGVLSTPQDDRERAAMASVLGCTIDELHHAYWAHRGDYDRGGLGAAGYWDAVAQTVGGRIEDGQLDGLVRSDIRSWSRLQPRVVDWVRAAAARVPLALLSNMPREVRDGLRPTIEQAAPFAHTVFSCDVGVVKPDAAIYAHTASLLDVPAHHILFVDDRIENVEGARGSGMAAVHVTGLADLEREVGPLLG